MSAPVAFKSFHELPAKNIVKTNRAASRWFQAVTIANTCWFETRLTWLLRFSDIGVWRWKRDLIVPLGA
jgi:hypothetical protein